MLRRFAVTDLLPHYERAAKLLLEARQCKEQILSDEIGTLAKLASIMNRASSATFEEPIAVAQIYEPVFGLVLDLLATDEGA